MPKNPSSAAGRFRDTGLLVFASSLWLVGLAVAAQLLFREELDGMGTTGQYLLSAGIEVLMLAPAAVYVAAKRIRIPSLFRAAEARQVITGAFLGFLIVPVSIALSLMMATFITLTGGSLFEDGAAIPATAAQVLAAFLALSIAAPLVEEVEFRAIILRGQSGSVGRFLAVLLTGLMFTMQHGRFAGFPSILMGGLVLTFLALHSGSIWPSVAAHFTYNTSLLMIQVVGSRLASAYSPPGAASIPPPLPMPGGVPGLDMAAASILWFIIAAPFAVSAAAVLWGYWRHTRGACWPVADRQGKLGFGAAWPWAAALVLLLGYLALDVLQIYGIIGT